MYLYYHSVCTIFGFAENIYARCEMLQKKNIAIFAIVLTVRMFYIRPVNKFTCDCSLSFVFLVYFLSFRSLNRIFVC